MALKLDGAGYTYVTAANASYPGGSFKNASAPGSSDGTPVEKQWLNDWLGFFSAIMVEAGLAYSGAPDTATASQYLQAIHAIIAASNVHQVDSFHASQTPAAGQIIVRTSAGDVTLSGETFSLLDVGTRSGVYQLAGEGNGTLLRSKMYNDITVNAQLDSAGTFRRLATGAAHMLEIDRTRGMSFYTAGSDASGTAITWSGPHTVWHAGVAPMSAAINGYQKLPNGLIMQWGEESSFHDISGNYSAALTFPIAFPSACLRVVPGVKSASGYAMEVSACSVSETATGFTLNMREWVGATQSCKGTYIAIGY